ncbi:MAG: ADP-ribosylglycohydrolase family protein [Spirochaetota bacterium]
MIGTIAGDVIGSVYEFGNVKDMTLPLMTERSHFTDDTVLTIATADVILNGGGYAKAYHDYGIRYPNAGYGGNFGRWLFSENRKPYGSYGNGSAMRVSPVGFAFDTLEGTLAEAKKSARVTHDHPEGMKGAQATAAAIFLARTGGTKQEIKEYIEKTFRYDLSRTLKQIRPKYKFDVTCQGSVPESIIAFLESEDYISAVRNAVFLGGDADTLGAITGGIAQAFYKKMPKDIVDEVRKRLSPDITAVVDAFEERYHAARVSFIYSA